MSGSQHGSHLPRTENPATLSKPGGHYSHVAIANGFAFVSGQLPITAQGDKLSDASFEVQAEQLPVPTSGNNVVVPMSRKLELTQLTERTCKWPIGDPLNDDFHFCGNESPDNSPYCTYHPRLAYQPSAERRRMR